MLIACMEITVMGSMWYLDSGASFNMVGNRDLFNELEEKDLKKNIVFGHDGRYNMTGIGIVTFHREFYSLLRLKDVIFILGIKNNLVFFAVLKDRGYDVVFSKGRFSLDTSPQDKRSRSMCESRICMHLR